MWMRSKMMLKLSVVVVFHNMRREARRTLFSLSPAYQREVSDWEVIAIDNGSSALLGEDSVCVHGPNFRYHYLETDSVSPVGAVNLGVRMARAPNIAVIVDGARMATPNLVGNTMRALRLFDDPFVYALSWHLGPDVQNYSMLDGYDQNIEDQLLDTVDWRSDGYRLFDISTLAQSSRAGFKGGVPPECSWLAMRKTTFEELGGYDARFTSPGGGLVNHDFRNLAMKRPGIHPVLLLGEGVFHQFHGGVATNVEPDHHPMHRFQEAYREIRGREYKVEPSADPIWFGYLPVNARRFLGADS